MDLTHFGVGFKDKAESFEAKTRMMLATAGPNLLHSSPGIFQSHRCIIEHTISWVRVRVRVSCYRAPFPIGARSDDCLIVRNSSLRST
jgi:hypothetical protein